MNWNDTKLAVIGLGYVGLPLAVAFGRKVPVIGFDINQERIEELEKGIDSTLEVSGEQLESAGKLSFSSSEAELGEVDIYIVTVPTPVDSSNKPNLSPLESASETVGRVISSGNIVIFESTVFPGATEDVCVPIIEKISGLRFNVDFFAGYSPERINPGDKQHRLENIVKVTSGSTPEIAERIDQLYGMVIDAGTHKAPSIKVAEAAKVIENTQRDLNIALINELALIFNRLDIDTKDVLEAAGTKWNFLPFRPGLVGGHCIGVDPYYLTFKAQEIGYLPNVILAGRQINDSMGEYVSNRVLSLLDERGPGNRGNASRLLVLGLAFKENCPDIRNTKVIDIVKNLSATGIPVDVFDPWVDPEEAESIYGVSVLDELPASVRYSGIVLAVAHRQFLDLTAAQFSGLLEEDGIIYDVKSALPRALVTERL